MNVPGGDWGVDAASGLQRALLCKPESQCFMAIRSLRRPLLPAAAGSSPAEPVGQVRRNGRQEHPASPCRFCVPKRRRCLARLRSHLALPRARSSSHFSACRDSGSAMLLVLIPVLGLHFAPRHAGAQSVSQADASVTVPEGAPVELRCTFSYGGAVFLFWYVQYPGQGLHPLLKYYSGDTRVQGIKGFEAEYSKSESSFHLRKRSARWSDAAEYFCALSTTVPGAAGGAEQNSGVPGRMTASGSLRVLPQRNHGVPVPQWEVFRDC
ncbi:T-cell receptor alpha chain V region PHDS58 [Fukomys damarensis]|nr:T-cell receptor alpha chain V region PHDS58 [Fukomys damarensis]